MVSELRKTITAEKIKPAFPHTKLENIKNNLPLLLGALDAVNMCEKDIVIYALATVAVENPAFIPLSERPSKYSDADGKAPYDFSKYDTMKSLGNSAGCGERFKGRGLIQLTGRANYQTMSKRLGMGDGLLEHPEAANEPHIAAAIFAQYFKDREARIRKALAAKDLVTLRKIVNGGTIGFQEFEKAYRILETIIV